MDANSNLSHFTNISEASVRTAWSQTGGRRHQHEGYRLEQQNLEPQTTAQRRAEVAVHAYNKKFMTMYLSETGGYRNTENILYMKELGNTKEVNVYVWK